MKRISPLHRLALTSLAALLAITFGLAGCSGSDSASDAGETARSEDRTRVETIRAEPSRFEDLIELTGTVEGVNDATLSAQTAGTVDNLVPLGRRVAAGTAVAQLDPDAAEAQYQQATAQVEAAQAQFDLAQDNFERQEPLYQDSVISAQEFQNVKAQRASTQAQLSQAKAAMSQAQEQRGNTAVTTMFAGTVEEHFVEEGEQVTPGMPVARVVNTQRVKVTAGVPERYASDLEVGTPVQLNFRMYGGSEQESRVTFVGSAINPQNRTFPIEVELDNRNGRFKPQMTTKMYVTREVLDDVLAVPLSAIVRDERGASLYIVREDSSGAVAERQPVTLGSSSRGMTVIQEGLEAGDQIIASGAATVSEGDKVQVVETQDVSDPASSAGQAVQEEPVASNQ
ncbi:MAG: efflux RND transporter periplasmic adaptor subunit [Rhodothermales bacterium]